MINCKTVLLWTGVAEAHTLLWTYSLLLPRYVPRMPELAPYKTSLKGLLTPGAAAAPPVCGSCMPCCGPNRGSYPTPGPCHQTSPSISQLCEFSYFGLQSLVIIQTIIRFDFLRRNKRRVHSGTRILQQSLENSRPKTQSMMTWSTQQQSILSHSDLIEQSPRGSGNATSNPKLGFILHSSRYHPDTWRIGRRSKNVAFKMQRPKEGISDPTTGIPSALPSLLPLSQRDRTARDFGFKSCEKTATKKKRTYLGRDLLLPRHSCRGLSCRSASSAVPERSVRVATKVQQEEVCSKLQPVRITWTLDRRRQQQKKKNRADGSPWWIFALVLPATSDCGRQ